jgi:RimJ/RimL family protein N-acetyltransferase
VIPVDLRSARLVLNQPGPGDVDEVTRLCQDPLFREFLTTPWPYERHHAVGFVRDLVGPGWYEDREYTWALRLAEDGPLIGVVGWRTERSDIGFWIGADHRRQGLMAEAVSTVVDWLFARDVPIIRWEAVRGNVASAATARSVGFRYTGEAPLPAADRDGSRPMGWHAELTPISLRMPRPGWPI